MEPLTPYTARGFHVQPWDAEDLCTEWLILMNDVAVLFLVGECGAFGLCSKAQSPVHSLFTMLIYMTSIYSENKTYHTHSKVFCIFLIYFLTKLCNY